jgi:hypothetical protein
MKIEDAIKVLSGPYHFVDGPYWKEIDEAVRAILPAAEKQIPKEPIRRERTLDGGGTTYWPICPSCKNRGLLDKWHRQLKHCRHCGQALKWPNESK